MRKFDKRKEFKSLILKLYNCCVDFFILLEIFWKEKKVVNLRFHITTFVETSFPNSLW